MVNIKSRPLAVTMLGDMQLDLTNMKNKPLIGLPSGEGTPAMGHNAFPDAFMITADIIERSLIQAGATPGKDYTLLDLYKLAQPFVLDRYQKRELSDVGYDPSKFKK
jgi:hypothetical protein